jgi:hypothetical protein
MSQDKQSIDLQLKPYQIEYIESMMEKYTIPDTGKAIRCMIDYAISEPRQERMIFEVVRCRGC